MGEDEHKGPDARNVAMEGAWAGVAGVGAVALVIGCCAGVPLLAALAGSVAAGTVVGIGAGAVVLVALVGFITLRARRRAAWASHEDPSEQPRASRQAERVR